MKLALTVVVACSSSATKPAPVVRVEPEPKVVDVEDRCPMLNCMLGPDDADGCPDPELVIAFAHDSTVIPPDATKILEGVAHAEPKLERGEHIFVNGEAADGEVPNIETRRVLAVISALRARGVPAERIVPGVTGPSHVKRVERVVIACD